MATPESFVWVQVYYEDKKEPDGNAFKIKPIPEDVADLAKAVKVEKPNALSHCDASNLDVYSPGTKPPFRHDEAIDGDKPVPTDTAYKHPLIVVAPPPLQTPAKKQKTDARDGERPIVAPKKAIPASATTDLTLKKQVAWEDHGMFEANLQGKCLVLQGSFENWIQTERDRFFVRNCYPELFKLVRDETCGDTARGVKITGTPGVGKSCFLDYVLFQFLEMKKCVLYVHGNTKKVYQFQPNGVVKVASPLAEVLESGATKFCDIVLLDAPDYAPTCQGLPHQQLSGKPFIISMSPDPENYQTLLKHTRPVTFYMGTLSWDEAQTMWHACYKDALPVEQLEDNFNLMGGIARVLFEFPLRGSDNSTITRDFKRKQEETLRDVLTGIRKVREQSVEVSFKHLWSVYHLNPFVDEHGVTKYQECDIAPYNGSVENMVLDALMKEEVQELWKSYSLYSSRHLVLGGIQYEAYAHRKIVSEGFSKCTAVILNKENTGRRTLTLNAPAKLERVLVDGMDMEGMANKAKEIQNRKACAYLAPVHFNFPIIDAALVTPEHVYLLQMKTGSPKRLKHKETSASKLCAFNDIKTSFVFIVPTESVIKCRFDSLQCEQFRLVLRETDVP